MTVTASKSNTAAKVAATAGAVRLSDLPRPRLCVALCAKCAERPALVPLADEAGNPAPGGLCRECVPAQLPSDPGQDAEYQHRARWSNPASLELVEQVARAHDEATYTGQPVNRAELAHRSERLLLELVELKATAESASDAESVDAHIALSRKADEFQALAVESATVDALAADAEPHYLDVMRWKADLKRATIMLREYRRDYDNPAMVAHRESLSWCIDAQVQLVRELETALGIPSQE